MQLLVSNGISDSDPVTVVINVIDPSDGFLTITSPPDGAAFSQTPVLVEGVLSQPGFLFIDNNDVVVNSDLTFSTAVDLSEGSNDIYISGFDENDSFNISQTLTLTLDTTPPGPPTAALISVSAPDSNSTQTITGEMGSVEPGATVLITNTRTGEQFSVTADENGAFTLTVNGLIADTYTVVATDSAGNSSTMSFVRSAAAPVVIPGDPAQMVTPVSTTQHSSVKDLFSFLFTGPGAVQTDLDPSIIQERSISLVNGKVLEKSGVPLPGVTVRILDHSEYGKTVSRADGAYDIALNGGMTFNVTFEKEGYLPVQRSVVTTWESFSTINDVVMIPVDSKVTVVDLTDTSVAIHPASGSISTDSDGDRAATVFFKSGITATAVLPDGQTQPLTSLSFRATEYTVGENGRAAMPASLPATSGYTYAVELSVDEAQAMGATTVEFSDSLPLYVDNFLELPVGTPVPTGWFDKTAGVWKPLDDGIVVKILEIVDGKAVLDITGDGVATTQPLLDKYFFTVAELEQLASSYTSGKTLWRSQVNHFTPVDLNYIRRVQEEFDELNPDELPVDSDHLLPDEKNEECGCTIDAESQALGEEFTISGSTKTLHYKSTNVSGYKRNFIHIPLLGDDPDSRLIGVQLVVDVMGNRFVRGFTPTTGLDFTYEWDGTDRFGRDLVGKASANIEVNYLYSLTYAITRDPSFLNSEKRLWRSFMRSGSAETLTAERLPGYAVGRKYKRGVYSPNNPIVNNTGVGKGMTLSSHHSLDVPSRTVLMGEGNTRKIGVGDTLYNVYRTEAVAATGQLSARSMVFDNMGGIYVALGKLETNHDRYEDGQIVYISPDGIATKIAGRYAPLYNREEFDGDGGPALDAVINPRGLTLAPDGTLYFTEASSDHAAIRKLSPDGIISTVAGAVAGGPSSFISTRGYCGDNGPAVDACFDYPTLISYAPDGSLYLTDGSTLRQRIRRITPDGYVTTVAGGVPDGERTQDAYQWDDGVQATSVVVGEVSGLAVSPEGWVYYTSHHDTLYFPPFPGAPFGSYDPYRGDHIAAIRPDGTLKRIAGKKLHVPSIKETN